tara:strand:+ start:225 stop:491 length:267 start_codon:yes stop_codon:yes gene_type:complete
MAVGDIVSGFSAINTILTFQPAGSNVCLITVVPNSFNYTLTDGVTSAAGARNNSVSEVTKLFINNTNYLYISSGGPGTISFFTGIQIA